MVFNLLSAPGWVSRKTCLCSALRLLSPWTPTYCNHADTGKTGTRLRTHIHGPRQKCNSASKTKKFCGRKASMEADGYCTRQNLLCHFPGWCCSLYNHYCFTLKVFFVERYLEKLVERCNVLYTWGQLVLHNKKRQLLPLLIVVKRPLQQNYAPFWKLTFG